MRCKNCNEEAEILVTGDDPHCPGCRYACGARVRTVLCKFDDRTIEVSHHHHGVRWSTLLDEMIAKYKPQKNPQPPTPWWRRMFGIN